jgi:hypothetical protein
MGFGSADGAAEETADGAAAGAAGDADAAGESGAACCASAGALAANINMEVSRDNIIIRRIESGDYAGTPIKYPPQ